MVIHVLTLIVNIMFFSSTNHHGGKAEDTCNYPDFTDEEVETLRN